MFWWIHLIFEVKITISMNLIYLYINLIENNTLFILGSKSKYHVLSSKSKLVLVIIYKLFLSIIIIYEILTLFPISTQLWQVYFPCGELRTKKQYRIRGDVLHKCAIKELLYTVNRNSVQNGQMYESQYKDVL